MTIKSITFITLGDITSIATMKRALGMANPLLKLGWAVSIITQDCEENRRRIGIECHSEVKVLYYQKASASEEVKSKTALVKKIKPSYIYFCSFSIRNRINKFKLGYKPEIIIEHSELQSSIPDNKGLKKLLAVVTEYGSVFYATKLVCASKYLEKEYSLYAQKCLKSNMPIQYSPYAYNSEVINSPMLVLDKLEEEYKDKKVFLYMGTMTRNYGLFTMLEAALAFKKMQQSFVLVLMGRGRHLEEAKNFVKKHNLEDVVEFPGYISEDSLSSYFKRADAFISPLNNTVQDIARCPSKIYMYLPFQKPVFTCALGEPKEIFKEKGYYFDNTKPTTLTKLMSDAYNGNQIVLNVDIEEHSWTRRSIDFNNWIDNN
jgi:glycosyltransferase involved in cell wall biosynthesis